MKSIHLSKYILKVKNSPTVLFNTESCEFIELSDTEYKNLCTKDFDSISLAKITELTEKQYLKGVHKSQKEILSKNEKEPNPLILSILTTSHCNAQCEYCFEKKFPKTTMEKSTAEKICRYILESGKEVVYITWFGGEPLLNISIIEHISDFLVKNKIKFYSSIITNGLLLNKISQEQLKKWNVVRIQVTLDSIREKYNNIKRFKTHDNAFEKVLKNLSNLIPSNITIKIRVNFSTESINDALETIEFIYNTFGNPRNLKVYVAHIYGGNLLSPLELPPDNNPYIILYKKLIQYGYIKELSQIGLSPKSSFCSRVSDYYVIDPSGNLYKCEHMLNHSKEKIGNIHQNILNHEKEIEWKSKGLPYQECNKCLILPSCRGGCKAKWMEYKKEFVCLPIKNCLEAVLGLFYENVIANNNIPEALLN